MFYPKVKTDMYKMLKIKSHLPVILHNLPLIMNNVYVSILFSLFGTRLLERKSKVEAVAKPQFPPGGTPRKVG